MAAKDDMADIFEGAGGGAPEPDGDEYGGKGDKGGDELSPASQAAADETWQAIQDGDPDAFAGAMKRFIHSCMDEYGPPSGGKGLDVLIGMGKPKKGSS